MLGEEPRAPRIPEKETLFENWLIAVAAESVGHHPCREFAGRARPFPGSGVVLGGQQRKPVVNSYECNFGFVMDMGLVRADGSGKCMPVEPTPAVRTGHFRLSHSVYQDLASRNGRHAHSW